MACTVTAGGWAALCKKPPAGVMQRIAGRQRMYFVHGAGSRTAVGSVCRYLFFIHSAMRRPV